MKKLLLTTILFSTVFTVNAAYAQENRENSFPDTPRNERKYDENNSHERWRHNEGKQSKMSKEDRDSLRETIRLQSKNLYDERDRLEREKRKSKN